MKWLLFIALFIVGAAVGMAIVPLLPNPIQKGIASFHLEIKHQVGIEERPDEMALSPTPTLGPGVTASPLSTSTPTPTTLPRVRVSLLPTPTSSPSPLPRVVVVPLPTLAPTWPLSTMQMTCWSTTIRATGGLTAANPYMVYTRDK